MKTHRLASLIIIASIMVVGCPKPTPGPGPTPSLQGGAAGAASAEGGASVAGAAGSGPIFSQPPVWNSADPCRSTYALLSWVDCAPASAGDAGWVEICVYDRTQGIKFVPPAEQACLSKATTKAAVRACGTQCP